MAKQKQKYYKFSQRSIDKLQQIHPELSAVMLLALRKSPIDFTITEGLRSKETQAKYVAEGSSQNMNSKHLTGLAVDIVSYPVSWDIDQFCILADCIAQAAIELGVEIRWGGCWKEITKPISKGWTSANLLDDYIAGKQAKRETPFLDCPHFELYKK